MITVLDLFCGAAGGWSLGLHRAGFTTVAACEIDPWRRAVFLQNFPKVRMYDDVRLLTADTLRRDLGALPDMIVGSPPCQDASIANKKGKGVDGARTGLFFEAIRLVRECRPRWCAFENSPNLRTRGVDRLLVGLEAIGYAPWPLVVGADDFRSPHERKRLWLLAADASRAIADRRGAFGGGGTRPKNPSGRGAALEAARHADGARLAIGESLGADACAQRAAIERAVGAAGAAWAGGCAGHLGMAHGVSARLAAVRVPSADGRTVSAMRACISAYGDAVLPQITEAIGRVILKVEAALACVDAQPFTLGSTPYRYGPRR